MMLLDHEPRLALASGRAPAHRLGCLPRVPLGAVRIEGVAALRCPGPWRFWFHRPPRYPVLGLTRPESVVSGYSEWVHLRVPLNQGLEVQQSVYKRHCRERPCGEPRDRSARGSDSRPSGAIRYRNGRSRRRSHVRLGRPRSLRRTPVRLQRRRLSRLESRARRPRSRAGHCRRPARPVRDRRASRHRRGPGAVEPGSC